MENDGRPEVPVQRRPAKGAAFDETEVLSTEPEPDDDSRARAPKSPPNRPSLTPRNHVSGTQVHSRCYANCSREQRHLYRYQRASLW